MSELEKAEQYEYCRFWSRSDGYIHCSDCVNCPDCKNIPEDDIGNTANTLSWVDSLINHQN